MLTVCVFCWPSCSCLILPILFSVSSSRFCWPWRSPESRRNPLSWSFMSLTWASTPKSGNMTCVPRRTSTRSLWSAWSSTVSFLCYPVCVSVFSEVSCSVSSCLDRKQQLFRYMWSNINMCLWRLSCLLTCVSDFWFQTQMVSRCVSLALRSRLELSYSKSSISRWWSLTVLSEYLWRHSTQVCCYVTCEKRRKIWDSWTYCLFFFSQADRSGPNFSTVYKNTEQMINVSSSKTHWLSLHCLSQYSDPVDSCLCGKQWRRRCQTYRHRIYFNGL